MIMKGLKRKGTSLIESMGNRNCCYSLLIIRHTLWVDYCNCNRSNSRIFLLCILLILGGFQQLQSTELMRIEGEQSVDMVGERCKKELVGDFEKWRIREKVWEKLEQGKVTSYIMKLHGSDQEVTKSMVGSWKDGRVKVNGVHF